ncbi:hypothetical protein AVEN_67793-1 [Araneus ventricosus]|uniref:Uncharacterized protein n=1 Tax=Araneus ventricosus TaxID=182803 RepID=A0A4Y2J799_ARAVE|nr:hypothetical protein AVEN_67793-1 [Araneus ventricosus]
MTGICAHPPKLLPTTAERRRQSTSDLTCIRHHINMGDVDGIGLRTLTLRSEASETSITRPPHLLKTFRLQILGHSQRRQSARLAILSRPHLSAHFTRKKLPSPLQRVRPNKERQPGDKRASFRIAGEGAVGAPLRGDRPGRY